MYHTKIASLRKEWALSQKELAQLIGTTRSSVSRLEVKAKAYSLEAVIKLVLLFDVSLDTLFPCERRAAFGDLVEELAEFSKAVEGEEGLVADRKRELLASFASRVPAADAA